jgi:hypothetical protein
VVLSCIERLGFGNLLEISCLCSAAAAQENIAASLSLLPPLDVRPLKLHTVGDVDLSHSLGIDFGCAAYETEYDINADGWYD